jgi:hypothetical protein
MAHVEMAAAPAAAAAAPVVKLKKSDPAAYAELLAGTDKERGLTSAVAAERLAQYGPNVLDDKKRNKLLLFLSFFWCVVGPHHRQLRLAAHFDPGAATDSPRPSCPVNRPRRPCPPRPPHRQRAGAPCPS